MTPDCSSRSEGMGFRSQGVGLRGLGHQHLERGNIGVPLDQCGHVAESPQRRAVQIPHRVAYRRAVRVDEQFLSLEFDGAVAGQMDFPDGAGIHGTVDTWSIGTAASHGCIRMTIPDVEDLYPRVPLHTPIYVG